MGDITDVVAEQGFSLDKPIEVKMKSGVVPVENMLNPVTMFKKLGENGDIDKLMTEIFTNPGTDPSQYGNLLKGLGGKIQAFVKGAIDSALGDAGLKGNAAGNAGGDAAGDAGGNATDYAADDAAGNGVNRRIMAVDNELAKHGINAQRRIKRKKRH